MSGHHQHERAPPMLNLKIWSAEKRQSQKEEVVWSYDQFIVGFEWGVEEKCLRKQREARVWARLREGEAVGRQVSGLWLFGRDIEFVQPGIEKIVCERERADKLLQERTRFGSIHFNNKHSRSPLLPQAQINVASQRCEQITNEPCSPVWVGCFSSIIEDPKDTVFMNHFPLS